MLAASARVIKLARKLKQKENKQAAVGDQIRKLQLSSYELLTAAEVAATGAK